MFSSNYYEADLLILASRAINHLLDNRPLLELDDQGGRHGRAQAAVLRPRHGGRTFPLAALLSSPLTTAFLAASQDVPRQQQACSRSWLLRLCHPRRGGRRRARALPWIHPRQPRLCVQQVPAEEPPHPLRRHWNARGRSRLGTQQQALHRLAHASAHCALGSAPGWRSRSHSPPRGS